ncbi:Os07g0663750, partial [Oryza sativa Japonica Group]
HRHRRPGAVRRDGVHPQAVARQRLRRGAHDGDGGCLGDGVQGDVGHGHDARVAGRAEDDAAAAGRHDARGVLDADKRRPGVDRHHAVEVGEVDGRHVVLRHGAHDTGVVVEDVEVAVPLHGEVDGRRDLCLVGDVAARVRGVRAELRCGGVAEVILDIGHDDLGAILDELLGCRFADAASSTGYDSHLASQP